MKKRILEGLLLLCMLAILPTTAFAIEEQGGEYEVNPTVATEAEKPIDPDKDPGSKPIGEVPETPVEDVPEAGDPPEESVPPTENVPEIEEAPEEPAPTEEAPEAGTPTPPTESCTATEGCTLREGHEGDCVPKMEEPEELEKPEEQEPTEPPVTPQWKEDTVAVIEDTEYTSLHNAISEVSSGEEKTITIVKDVHLTNHIKLQNGKKITLVAEGKHTISFDLQGNMNTYCIEVCGSAMLTLGGGNVESLLTITNTANCRSLVGVWDGENGSAKLILKDGAVLRVGKNTTITDGIVNTWQANFEMNGGEIIGTPDSGDKAVGVLIKANGDTFTMNGGTIKNCSASGVYVRNGAFTMNGGEITKCSQMGGSYVHVREGATFTYQGGTVEDVVARIEGKAYHTLHDAIGAVPDNASKTIVIVNDILMTDTVNISKGKKITMISDNGNHTISFNFNDKGKVCFNVSESSKLTFGGGSEENGVLTITNQSDCTKLVDIWTGEGSSNYSELVLKDGAVLKAGEKKTIVQSIVHTWNANFTMDGGKIDGNSNGNATAKGVYIQCAKDTFKMTGGTITNCLGSGVIITGGTFTMTGGTITNCSGSGVYMTNGTFKMTDGKITNCSNDRGGGVHLAENGNATFTLNGGTISENEGKLDGGGVYVAGGEFKLVGGSITKNQAGKDTSYTDSRGQYLGRGGGVAVFNGAKFSMTGGSVTNNIARIQGGGIYLMGPGKTSTNNCEYIISAGKILDNELTDMKYGYGGGIYVDKNVTLNLTNVLIKENTASALGGGIWSCRTGDIKIYVTEGGAVFGNSAANSQDKSSQAGDDMASTVTFPAEGFLLLSHHMLGGGANRYYVDGGVTGLTGTDLYGYGLGAPDGKTPRYDAATSTLVTDTNIKKSIALKNVASEDAQTNASSAAKLIISGNSASRGGGIGTNGNLIIGKDDSTDETGSLTVRKEITGSGQEPDRKFSIQVTLKSENGDAITGEYGEMTFKNGVATVELKAGQSVTATGLPVGASYTVQETPESQNGYHAIYTNQSGAIVKDTTVTATVTNKKTAAGRATAIPACR